MYAVAKELIDLTGLQTVTVTNEQYQEILTELVKKADQDKIQEKARLNPEEKQYNNYIQTTLTDSIWNTATTVEESSALVRLVNGNFNTVYEKQALINTVNHEITTAITESLFGNSNKLYDIIDMFYQKGKTGAFKDMKVTQYMSPVDIQALNHISNYNFGLIQQVTDETRSYIQRELFQNIEKGMTIPEIAKDIERTGIKPITNPHNGYTWTVPKRARMIAVTEANRAANQARLVGYQQYGVEKVDIVGPADGKTCADCLNCLNNNPYPINNVPILPRHPWCRHTYGANTDPEGFPSDVDWNAMALLTRPVRVPGMNALLST